MDIDKLVANSNSKALDFVDYWLAIDNEKYANYLNNKISKEIPLNFNNEAIDKIKSTIISKIVEQGSAIENVRIYRSSLEDVFMKLTGKSLQVEAGSIESQEGLMNV